MIIFDYAVPRQGRLMRQVVALFGMGLIGRSIAVSTMRANNTPYKEFSFSWQDSKQRQLESLAIERQIIFGDLVPTPNTGKLPSPPDRVDIIWAAGRAGFGSSVGELKAEMDAFGDVVGLSERLAARLPLARHIFHLVSSAGGLFEGRRQVDRTSVPSPKRPYGEAKLQQERNLARRSKNIQTFVYRLSSVYGFSGTGVRIGLINALLHNSTRHRVSVIYGDAHTIRDYVLASDIGNFVAERLVDQAYGAQVFFLVSGKPSSTVEILRKVELAVGRKMYLKFDARPSNASDNSFSQDVLPTGWRPTDPDTGIRQTTRQLMSSFIKART